MYDLIYLILSKKKIFFVLLFLQLLLIIIVVSLSALYTQKIMTNLENITSYAESLNVDVQTAPFDIMQQKLPLGNDPLSISRNYNEIKKNLSIFVVLLLFFYAVFNGTMLYIIKKKTLKLKNNEYFRYLGKFLAFSLILFLIVAFFLYALSKIVFSVFLQTEPVSFIPLLLIGLIAFYFAYIAFPLIDDRKIMQIIAEALHLGVKKFFWIIFVFLIMIFALAASALLIFISLEKNIVLLSLSHILLLIMTVLSKIFYYNSIQNLRSF